METWTPEDVAAVRAAVEGLFRTAQYLHAYLQVASAGVWLLVGFRIYADFVGGRVHLGERINHGE